MQLFWNQIKVMTNAGVMKKMGFSEITSQTCGLIKQCMLDSGFITL